MRVKQLAMSVVLCCLALCGHAETKGDTLGSQLLARAVDYFQSGKYHEAMPLFLQLDKQYKLNPRYRAYAGVCCYYEWDYKNAARLLDAALPKLSAFSPEERSFYYFADAESHFNLEEWDQALPLYETMLTVCRDNEKPDAYYRIGYIYVQKQQWIKALDNLQSSLVYYRQFKPAETARIAQARNMIVGCCEKIDKQNAERQNNKSQAEP